MTNTHLLELPLSRTYFHGPKDVRAIEVRLYVYDNYYTIMVSEITNRSFAKNFFFSCCCINFHEHLHTLIYFPYELREGNSEYLSFKLKNVRSTNNNFDEISYRHLS